MFKCMHCDLEVDESMLDSVDSSRRSKLKVNKSRYNESPRTYCPQCGSSKFTLSGEDVERLADIFYARVPEESLGWSAVNAGSFPGAAENMAELLVKSSDDESNALDRKFIVQVKQGNSLRAYIVETEVSIECHAQRLRSEGEKERVVASAKAAEGGRLGQAWD